MRARPVCPLGSRNPCSGPGDPRSAAWPQAPTCQAGSRGEPREAAGAGPALRGRDLGAGTARRGGSTSVRRPLHLARSWTAGCGFRWDADSAGAPERSPGALRARPKGRLHAHRPPSSSSAPAPPTTACQPRPPRGGRPRPGLSTKRLLCNQLVKLLANACFGAPSPLSKMCPLARLSGPDPEPRNPASWLACQSGQVPQLCDCPGVASLCRQERRI